MPLYYRPTHIFPYYLPVAVINRVSKTGRIHNGQCQIHAVLFQQHFGRLDGHRLFDALRRSRVLVLVVDVRQEHGVDQRGLAQTGFACKSTDTEIKTHIFLFLAKTTMCNIASSY